VNAYLHVASPTLQATRQLIAIAHHLVHAQCDSTISFLSAQANCSPAFSSILRAEALILMFTPRPIGFVTSPYKDTAAIPKGLGVRHEAEGVLQILPEFDLGLTGIEGFSHLFVLWVFDRSGPFELIATPPSDNQPHGVFATRSPRRPNPIGLTVVELLRREKGSLYVRGVDMLDQTPILDIKPYLSSIPAESLRRGWLAEAEALKH
jgi:tRNA-Thr(GGU) m(6)t(6)A37 methyltransferase TsaA